MSSIANAIELNYSSRNSVDSSCIINTSDKSGVGKRKTSIRYVRKSNHSLLLIESDDPGSQKTLYVINELYMFHLVEKSKPDHWVVVNACRNNADGTIGNSIRNSIERYSINKATATLGTEALHDILRSKSLKINEITNEAKDLVRIVFDYDPSQVAGRPVNPLRSGTVILDSSNMYSILKYSIKIKRAITSSAELITMNSISRNENGVVMPVNVVADSSSTNINYSYLYNDVNAIDNSIFYLNHYGVDIPAWLVDNSSSHSFPWFLYLSIAGMLCMLLATLMLYRRKSINDA